MLYRSLSVSKVPYALPYVDKSEERINQSIYVTATDNYTKYVLEGLEKLCNIRGRNMSIIRYFTKTISIKRFFTSMTISNYLIKRGITLVGKLRADSKGIPSKIKNTKNQQEPHKMYASNKNLKAKLLKYINYTVLL